MPANTKCQFEMYILTNALRRLGPLSTNTRDKSGSNHCKCFSATELYWVSMVIRRDRRLGIAVINVRYISTGTLLLWKSTKICQSLKYYLSVYMDTNKSIDLPLNITNFNTLPIHTGKAVHSPSTHWILWEPFIRNLGLQAYSTTSLCAYSSLCISFPFPLRSWGGGAHNFTCPSVEISCKLWLHCLFYHWKIQLMQKFILLNDLLFIILYTSAFLNNEKGIVFTPDSCLPILLLILN